VPKPPTYEDRQVHMETYMQFFQQYYEEGKTILPQAMKHGCIPVNLQPNIKAWSGNILHHPGP